MYKVVLCICTYKRPDGLLKLLRAVEQLDFDDDLSLVVIDNAAGQEGLNLCRKIESQYRWPMKYAYEPQGGIPYARNTAVKTALESDPDFIAMLDDDEWPSRQWLTELIKIQRKTAADFVGGPVKPVFPADTPPPWFKVSAQYYGAERELEDGNFCVLYASGNFLGRAECFRILGAESFSPYFSVAGGEDLAFFQEMEKRGYKMAWSKNAVVYETVPESRMSISWLKERVIRQSNLNVLVQRKNQQGILQSSVRFMKTAVLLVVGSIAYIALLPHRILRIKSAMLIWKALGRIRGHLGYQRVYSGHGGE